MYKDYLDVNPEVAKALSEGLPVVALESTIIAHGMPYPKNVETALAVEEVIRENGAVPATIGILGGRIKIGLTKEEIEGAYEENTGHLIVNEFNRMGKDPMAVPAVLCKNHGPFAWGKDAHEAVHNAVVLEEVAKMAYRAETINPRIQPAPQELQDKHYYRKHGANAYYGQN